MKAKMAYTYGWTDRDIQSMPYKTFLEYWLAIKAIESEEQMLEFEANCFSKLEKSKRKEVIGRYRRNVSSVIDRTDGKLATVKDLAKAFARMKMNG
jgi:hypothetical protein